MHNYSQYSKKNDYVNEEPKITPEVIEEVEEVSVVDTPEIDLVEETVETVILPETVTGVVVNCSKLNVRVAPVINAEVACVLEAKTEIEINVAESTDEWFKVCTAAGIEGYCMRKFVDASL